MTQPPSPALHTVLQDLASAYQLTLGCDPTGRGKLLVMGFTLLGAKCDETCRLKASCRASRCMVLSEHPGALC